MEERGGGGRACYTGDEGESPGPPGAGRGEVCRLGWTSCVWNVGVGPLPRQQGAAAVAVGLGTGEHPRR